MSAERRPHWDDDLVNVVIDLQYHCVDCMEDDYPDIDPRNHDAVNAAWAYEIIAAVEDWQDKQVIGCRYACVGSFKERDAAIQRVRELHNPIPGFNGSLWCGAHCEATADGDPTEYPCETIRALDGTDD